MTNSIPLRHDYMSHLPFFPAEESKGCEIGEIRHPRGGYIHAKGQKIFTDLESSGHGKKDVGTLVSYRQDEGKTFPCKSEHWRVVERPLDLKVVHAGQCGNVQNTRKKAAGAEGLKFSQSLPRNVLVFWRVDDESVKVFIVIDENLKLSFSYHDTFK